MKQNAYIVAWSAHNRHGEAATVDRYCIGVVSVLFPACEKRHPSRKRTRHVWQRQRPQALCVQKHIIRPIG